MSTESPYSNVTSDDVAVSGSQYFEVALADGTASSKKLAQIAQLEQSQVRIVGSNLLVSG